MDLKKREKSWKIKKKFQKCLLRMDNLITKIKKIKILKRLIVFNCKNWWFFVKNVKKRVFLWFFDIFLKVKRLVKEFKKRCFFDVFFLVSSEHRWFFKKSQKNTKKRQMPTGKKTENLYVWAVFWKCRIFFFIPTPVLENQGHML